MGDDPDTPITNPSGWEMQWNEPFSDLTAWNCTWDGQLVFRTTIDVGHSYVKEGGGLQIRGDYEKDVTNIGGLIDSKQSYLYGYFECRCKVPKGQGLWPAFWLYAVGHERPIPEIDIFEFIDNRVIYCTSHVNYIPERYAEYIPDPSGNYHTFACKWEPGSISYYLDNHLMTTKTASVPNEPLNVMLNVYVGGDWPGDPVPSIVFPVFMDVEYVKVWQRK